MQNELFGKYPVYYEHQEVGTLSITRDGLRAYFHCACKVHSQDVLRLFLINKKQQIPLGVMMPNGEYLQFTKHFTKHDLHMRDILSIDSCTLATNVESIPSTQSKAKKNVLPPIPAITAPLPAPTPPPVAPVAPIKMPAPMMPQPLAPAPPIAEAPTPPKQEVWSVADKGIAPIEAMVATQSTFVPPPITPEPTKAPIPPLTPPTSDWEFIDTWGKVEKDGTEHFTLHPPEDAPPSPVVEDTYIQDINPYPEAVHSIETATWSSVESMRPPKESTWIAKENISSFFTDPLLKAVGNTVHGGLVQHEGAHTKVAIRFESGAPFPLMPIFCKGEPMNIEGKTYLVFTLENGQIR